MTYASNLTSGSNPALGYSARRRAPQRERNLNAGYILFAVGALWILAVAAWMIATSATLPQCLYTATGDAAICGSNALVEPPVSQTGAGLDVASLPISAGLSGAGYDAF